MDLKIKLLELPNGGNYLIVITRGIINAEGFEQIFRKVAETNQAVPNCKFLIDLEEASLRLDPSDIHVLVHPLGSDLGCHGSKIAFVSSAEIESKRLRVVSDSLCSLGLKVAVFDDAKSAAVWVSDMR